MPQRSLHPALDTLLASVRRRIRVYVWLQGLATAVGGGCAWHSGSAWRSIICQEPPPSIRVALLVLAGVVLRRCALRLILRRAFVRLSDRSMALLLERRYGQFQDSLLTSVELGDAEARATPWSRRCSPPRGPTPCRCFGGIDVKKVFNPQPLSRAALAGRLLAFSVVALRAGRAGGAGHLVAPHVPAVRGAVAAQDAPGDRRLRRGQGQGGPRLGPGAAGEGRHGQAGAGSGRGALPHR